MATIRYDGQEKTGGELAVNLDGISAIETDTAPNGNPLIRFIPMHPYGKNVTWEYEGSSAETNRDAAYSSLQTSDMTERT